DETSGFGESRMTARSVPRAIPIAIAVTVNSSVVIRPWTTEYEKKYWRTTLHSKREFVAIDFAIAAPKTRMIAPATQRPGWRTGIALMSSALTGCWVADVVAVGGLLPDPP